MTLQKVWLRFAVGALGSARLSLRPAPEPPAAAARAAPRERQRRNRRAAGASVRGGCRMQWGTWSC
eukprot:10973356-Alexandrium_andersonii.AAC.1